MNERKKKEEEVYPNRLCIIGHWQQTNKQYSLQSLMFGILLNHIENESFSFHSFYDRRSLGNMNFLALH